MKVKEQIFNTLRKKYALRKVISDTLNVKEINIYLWAYRKQHNKVGNSLVIEILKRELQITDKEIFEPLNA